uniref:mitogen-activated protein kinase kinase kinase n=1 Tax=Phallusia mammillata TaxID=59560 RepID=A0A6F9DRR5_9ASCI|nr:receptor-interacting serine/threonine-protein kinase 1-like [Phallusia mammillata]
MKASCIGRRNVDCLQKNCWMSNTLYAQATRLYSVAFVRLPCGFCFQRGSYNLRCLIKQRHFILQTLPKMNSLSRYQPFYSVSGTVCQEEFCVKSSINFTMASTNELQELDCGDIKCNPDKFVAGSGGFGDVLFGYHCGLKREVAIKIFEVSGGTQEKERLEKTIKEEMEHLQKADHENVVRVFGYVKWSFAMGIVMEYYKGGNLKELLQDTSKELGLAVRVRILYEIASAMAFCHNLPDKRLIHQDLKPENVMFSKELHCKIIDFGGAELATYSISANVNPLARSKKERPQFTPYYTAPEKLKDLTMKPRKQHDVYAFSMITYWTLTRKAPYPRLTQEERRELLEEIKKGKRPDCQEIHDWIQTLDGEDKEIAEQLQLLMKRCWDQDPTKRPTMTEIKEELKTRLDQQKTTKLLSQVLTTLTQMGSDEQPQVSEGQSVPLHYFSTRAGNFHVPSTSGGTEGRVSEPAEGAKVYPSSQQVPSIPSGVIKITTKPTEDVEEVRSPFSSQHGESPAFSKTQKPGQIESNDTKKQSFEPTESAQEHKARSFEEEEIPTNRNAQQSDAVSNDDGKPNMSVQNLIARFNSISPQQPADSSRLTKTEVQPSTVPTEKSRHLSNSSPQQPTDTKVKRRVKVCYSYEPKDFDELQLKVGDIIDVYNELEGWSIGRCNGKEGLFPANYAIPLEEVDAPTTSAAYQTAEESAQEEAKKCPPHQVTPRNDQPNPQKAQKSMYSPFLNKGGLPLAADRSNWIPRDVVPKDCLPWYESLSHV